MRTVTRSVGRRGLGYYRFHFRESIERDGAVCLECGKLLLTAFRRGSSPAPIATRLGVSKRYVIAKTTSSLVFSARSSPAARRARFVNSCKETKPNATRRG